MSSHQFFWFDGETTGLIGDGPGGPKPGDLLAGGQILEWALVLAEDDRGDDYAEVEAYTAVVKPAAPLEMNDFVRRMHTNNGLLADVAKATATIEDSDEFLADICHMLDAKPRSVMLAGNSVHFDATWIRKWMPRFAAFLSHRVYDVSVLRKALQTYGPGFDDGEPAHRALDDVRHSLATALAFRKAVGW